MPRPEVFFALGRGRSGTTLLGRMLGNHPRVEVAPEGFFVLNLARKYSRGRWDDRRVDAFCRDLVLENRMKTWKLDLNRVGQSLREALPQLGYGEACRLVYASYARDVRERTDVHLVGDKNNHYTLFAPRLAKLFPSARFVHIVRDPRDNVMSFQTVPFDVNDTAALAYRWRRYNHELLRAADQSPGKFLRIRYEDLVAEPEQVLGQVCDFLGETFDPEMLSFFERRHESFHGKGSDWHDKLDRPVDAKQARKWESALSPEDLCTIEGICGAMMDRFGYDRVTSGGTTHWDRCGAAFGWATVEAEKAIFGYVPAELRIWAINTHRARSGRV